MRLEARYQDACDQQDLPGKGLGCPAARFVLYLPNIGHPRRIFSGKMSDLGRLGCPLLLLARATGWDGTMGWVESPLTTFLAGLGRRAQVRLETSANSCPSLNHSFLGKLASFGLESCVGLVQETGMACFASAT